MNRESVFAKKLILVGAITLALAVIFGAFGAHSLKAHLTDHQLGIFETGNRYHFIHGLGLLCMAGILNYVSTRSIKVVMTLILIGILLFSGSLYLLAMREFLNISSWKFLGPLTPIGGLFFIAGWFYLAYAAHKEK